jgi:hypothetical protein
MQHSTALSLADTLADITGAQPEVWHSGGGIWLVKWTNEDGNLVVFSDDLVCEYADEDAFRRGDYVGRVVISTEKPKTDRLPDPPQRM